MPSISWNNVEEHQIAEKSRPLLILGTRKRIMDWHDSVRFSSDIIVIKKYGPITCKLDFVHHLIALGLLKTIMLCSIGRLVPQILTFCLFYDSFDWKHALLGKTIFRKCLEYPPERDEQCCANSSRFPLSVSLVSWRLWWLYGKRKRQLCKILWTFIQGMPDWADAVRILNEELCWSSCLNCSIISSLIEGHPFPPLWSTLLDFRNARYHLRISVRYGAEFCMTRWNHHCVRDVDLVRW